MKVKKLSTMRLPMYLPAITLLLLSVAMVSMLSSCQNNKTDSLTPPPPDEIFTQVDEMPVFAGGDQGLLKYIAENTKYPDDAKQKGISGRVIIGFVVEKDGTVSQPQVLKGVDPSLDAEALRVVGSLPAFEKPGKKAGEAVRVHFMVPLTFALK